MLAKCVGVVLGVALIGVGARDAAGTPAKGEGPQAIAVAFGSIWVGMGDGAVLRIDAETSTVQSVFEGSGLVHALAPGYGSMWVLQDRVVRIDPRSGFAQELPETGSARTFDLAIGAGAVWVAYDGSNVVARIDPRRGRRVATVRIPGRAWGLAASHRQVLVVSAPTPSLVAGSSRQRELRRIDPVTNRVSSPLARLDCDPVIAMRPQIVWTIDPCIGVLTPRDPTTLAPTGFHRIPRWGWPVIGFGSLWIAGSRWLARVDLRTLRVIARIKVGGGSPVIGKGALWLLGYGRGRAGVIYRVDPRTNRVVATILRSAS